MVVPVATPSIEPQQVRHLMELMNHLLPHSCKVKILTAVAASLLLLGPVNLIHPGFCQDLPIAESNEGDFESKASDRVIELFIKTSLRIDHGSVDAALDAANDSLDLTIKTGDEDLRFVAQAHVDSVQTLIRGIGDEVKRQDYSKLKFSSIELRLRYFSVQLQSRFWHLEKYTDFKQLLEEYAIAADESGDLNWILRQRTDDFYVRLFGLNVNPSLPELTTKFDMLKKLSTQQSYSRGLCVCSLFEGVSLRGSSQIESRIKAYKQALDHAVESNHSFLIYKCYDCLAISHLSKNDFEGAEEYQVKAIETLESVGASALATAYLRKLALVKRRSGKPMQELNVLHRAFDSPSYPNLPELEKVSFERMYGEVVRVVFDEGAKSAGKNGENEHSLELFGKVAQSNQRARNAEANKRQADQEYQADQLKKNQVIASQNSSLKFFKNLAIGLGALVIFLVPWSAMYFLKARLKKVSQELDSERAVARESQDQCDELSHRINRLQRMESLGLMAGSVAHDFNNILVGVMGNAEVIQLKNECKTDLAADDEFVRERIRNIITSAEKAASLSRQMLAYAGKQYIARTTTDLNELIRQYETILHSSCRKNQKLKFELDPGQVVSKVDVTQIEQVVLNLVTNAAEASDDEGTITVRTGSLEITQVENDRFLFGARTTGGSFNFIDVIDSGSGISEKHIDRIFEPFFTNSELGRGLGLSVVYGAVTGHDGFVQCKSEIGVGASFRIMIPCSTEAIISNESAESFPRAEFLEESDADTMQKILVIDDEETVLELCSELMQLNGWEVIKAVGGDEGLRLAKQHASELTCILADVVMPEMGANELLRELELREINVPVVLMSGFSQTRLEFFLEKENVVSIVQKPFRASEIKRAVLTASRFKKTPEMVSIAKVPNPDYPK